MSEYRRTVICLLVAIGAFGACSRQPATTTTAATQAAPAALQPAAAAPQADQSAPQVVTGSVVETMDAANYTYVRVKTDKGEIWAATSTRKIAVGDRVVVPLDMPMENFRSKALNREFPLIYFSSEITREGETVPPLTAAHAPMGGATPGVSAPQVTEPMPPPPGGLTVAAVWAQRAALAGKSVTVRGKVVKFNASILDRNWVHIQDGTGAVKDGTNDLTVTTAAGVKLGDIITATGTVAIDKDFGAGYAYGVIVEGATVVVK